MSDKLVTQVDLIAISGENSLNNPGPRGRERVRQMTTWLEHSKTAGQLLTVGRELQLKDIEDTWWRIAQVYDTRKASEIDKRGWDNNNYDKHEGLFK